MQCLAASHIHRGVKNSISQLVLRALHGDAREKVLPEEWRWLCGCLGSGCFMDQVDRLLGSLIRPVTRQRICFDYINYKMFSSSVN